MHTHTSVKEKKQSIFSFYVSFVFFSLRFRFSLFCSYLCAFYKIFQFMFFFSHFSFLLFSISICFEMEIVAKALSHSILFCVSMLKTLIDLILNFKSSVAPALLLACPQCVCVFVYFSLHCHFSVIYYYSFSCCHTK